MSGLLSPSNDISDLLHGARLRSCSRENLVPIYTLPSNDSQVAVLLKSKVIPRVSSFLEHARLSYHDSC
jgi:hypothetical protein